MSESAGTSTSPGHPDARTNVHYTPLAFPPNLLGRVRLVRPPGLSLITLFCLTLILLIALFLQYGHYARKETVTGYLSPLGGTVDVFADRPGTVIDLLVVADQSVASGDHLATIALEHWNGDGNSSIGKLLEELRLQEQSIQQRALHLKRSFATERSMLTSLFATHSAELKESNELLEIITRQRHFSHDRLRMIQHLHKGGHVSKLEMLAAQRSDLEELQQLKITSQRHHQLRVQLTKDQHGLDQLPNRLLDEQARLALELSAVRQRRTELQQQQSYQIRAPVAGRVTLLQGSVGQSAKMNHPLLTLIPQNSPLVARLLIPTRAAGFIRPGQSVNLLYDAFPHQHFGVHAGKLVNISQSVVKPQELNAPVPAVESMYLAQVKLSDQYVVAAGKNIPLQAGMSLKADIELESRNLIHWLMAPLYTLRGRT